jgi:hypothetical protein
MKKLRPELLLILVFVLSRLPDMGHDNFTTDTWKWKSRTYDFGTGIFTGDFNKTLQKYHPGVTLMWLGTLGIKTYNFYYHTFLQTNPRDNDMRTIFELDFVQKFFLTLVLAVTSAMIFHVLRKLFGSKFALFGWILLVFEPYYIGLTRVYHLEGLMSTFMLCSALWLYCYLDKQKRTHLLFSAIFSGLAILTKTSALFMLPFTGLMLLVFSLMHKKPILESVKKTLIDTLIYLGITIFVIFTLWPALWVDPRGVYLELFKGVSTIGIESDHIQYYFGKLVADPGFTFYPVVMFIRISPWILIGLIGTLILAWKKKIGQRRFVLFLAIFSVFYLIQLTIPSKKLDRYILPAILSVTLMAVPCYIWLCDRLKQYKYLLKGFLVSVIVLTNSYLHPDYFTYFTPLIGGLTNGIKIVEPKWLIGEREILSEVKKLMVNGNYVTLGYGSSLEKIIQTEEDTDVMIVGFQEKYYTQIWPFLREAGAWAVINDMTAQAKFAKYVIYPVWDDASAEETRFRLKEVSDIKIRGVTTYHVYQKL